MSFENDNQSIVQKLSIDQLRKFDGLESLSDSEAIEMTESLLLLALITYNLQE